MLKQKLNCLDQSEQVPTVMKTKWDNDVTNSTDVLYAKNETDLS